MVENAFLSPAGRFSHLSEYNSEDHVSYVLMAVNCLLFFILPDECFFQRNKRGNEGYMMENDEIIAKPRGTMEDHKAFRSTGTSS